MDRAMSRLWVFLAVTAALALMTGCKPATQPRGDWQAEIRSDDWIVRLRSVPRASKAPLEEAVPALIERLEDTDDAVASMAYEALLRITGQKIAFDPLGDASERRRSADEWRKWWEARRTEEKGGVVPADGDDGISAANAPPSAQPD